MNDRSALKGEHDILASQDLVRIEGKVRRLVGLVAEAEGLPLSVGSCCRIECRSSGQRDVEAEVIGFRDDRTLLVPYGQVQGIAPGDPVHFEGDRFQVRLSQALLGRVLDGCGEPIDERGPISMNERRPVDSSPISPLTRKRITEPFSTGIRAIDTMLTIGRGQRVGIFAGSGVGKSVLMGMLARSSSAPVNVICLVGERGREVREFVERDLGPEGLARSIVVVATADEPPVMRIRAVRVATTIAEWFRDQDQDVLLLVDSITRVALAQRELGISANEPPTTKAYPPSVFALLPQLLERAGPAARGTITGLYSVLVEADDINDPIGDAVRGILDGHIWLSRDLANRGHFPAIDVLESVSRVMQSVTTPEHQQAARSLVEDLARYRDSRDLIQLGAYVRGTDPRTDGAVDRMPAIEQLLRQLPDEHSTYPVAVQSLRQIHEAPGTDFARRAAAAAATGNPAPTQNGEVNS